ncbi:MAG: hypothetical protein M3336_16320, partial [Chloroflexota bacterium]|nr:hypothetical protein [Chloroflexota bacterium]
AAEQLWSQHMRGSFPPSENIVERFTRTQALDVLDAQVILLDEVGKRATVSVVLLENVEPSGTRRYRGTWELVRIGEVWLLDQPDLRLE